MPATVPMLTAVMMAAVPVSVAAAAPTSDADRRAILAEVAATAPEMERAALAIWDYAEQGFQETRSSALLQAQLRAAGFTVQAGVAGMPTAFVARFRTGDGPVIGLLAEFDALPGLAQAALPHREPIAGRDAGHACGHNLLGAATVAAAVAARRWMAANHVAGELRVYGAPAEEGGSGIVFMVRAGLVRDIDAMLHWHPGDRNFASQGRTLANISGTFRFTGIASHAAVAPERGRSALDGVEAMDLMVNQMREHVPQETRIHYVITNGGKAPNVVPETAEVYYYVRHPDRRWYATSSTGWTRPPGARHWAPAPRSASTKSAVFSG
ncbi:amidohydrolase [Sphingomonas sp. 1185]|uniref:amidohydrolase n=1 Tax=Sphingomonas sp. 1185 TaxID=3156411 RepID=UPI0033995192